VKFVECLISELKHYPNNPRVNNNAIPKVKESIRKYGYKVPIVIDCNNFIVAGHTRHAALRELLEEGSVGPRIYCILADDLTENQIKEFRIVDNLVAENSEWDISALKIELESLPDLNIAEFGEIPALTLEDIQLQEEQKLSSDKIYIKIGPEKIEMTEAAYHEWAHYVVTSHNMTVLEFVRKQLHLNEADREYEELDI
jgi:ParB family chromosome partitioning protein